MSSDRIIKVRMGEVVWIPNYFEQLTALILTSYNDGVVYPKKKNDRQPIEVGVFDIGGGLNIEVDWGRRPIREPNARYEGADIALKQAAYVLDRWSSGKMSDMIALMREAFSVYGGGKLIKTIPSNL